VARTRRLCSKLRPPQLDPLLATLYGQGQLAGYESIDSWMRIRRICASERPGFSSAFFGAAFWSSAYFAGIGFEDAGLVRFPACGDTHLGGDSAIPPSLLFPKALEAVASTTQKTSAITFFGSTLPSFRARPRKRAERIS
jgi:hypothetical protein